MTVATSLAKRRLIAYLSEGSGASTVIFVPCGWGRLGNSSLGTASSLASRWERMVGVMISMPASAKASSILRRNSAWVSKMASLVLVQARRWYSTEVPKCLFQDFGSWVGYDLLGSAGALDQASLLSSRIVSKLLLCKIQRSVDGRRACALSVWLERARLSKLLTNVVHVDFEANAVRGLAIP
jgi:hypothetical protein